MDNWAPTIVYQLAIERHGDDLRRGDGVRQLAMLAGGDTLRARLAHALRALATRLDTAAQSHGKPMSAAPLA